VIGTNAELTRRWLLEVWGPWVMTSGICTVIWLISWIGSAEPIYFWPVWVAGPLGAVLVFVTLGGLANGEPRKQAEKRARKERAKELKRERRALEADAAFEGEVHLPTAKRDKELG
jgi:hypothetical protein